MAISKKQVRKRGAKGIKAFNESAEAYDKWYCEEPGLTICECETKALKDLELTGLGVEVGVGTGVFASRLNTAIGVDPALEPIKSAKKKGITAVRGAAESLPFKNDCFDYVTSIMAVFFLKDPVSSFMEARRILKSKGDLIVCFTPKSSHWGISYQKKKGEGHRLYKYATFYDKSEIETMLQRAGFKIEGCSATLLQPPDAVTCVEEPCREPTGHGFVCVKGKKI
ncbi:MAG: hypothetical protein QG670_1488 [Thermoproteota archaeon]|nr:hypothetical protein [Thermoproteota archaeon]